MSLRSWLGVGGPSAAVELGARRVAAALVESRGGRAVVAAHAVEPLPEGVLVASLTETNVRERPMVTSALERVLSRIGRPRRIGLVVGDPVARVSIVRFEQVPARTSDLDQLIRWQIKKAAPFPVEEAQVSYIAGARSAEGQEFVVSMARRSVIADYEAVCAAAGAQAGLVDVATLNVVNAVLAGPTPPGGDWMLVHVAHDFASIALLRDGHLIFFRSRGADDDGTLADLVHQSAMYYEDRLSGSGLTRVLLAGASRVDSPKAQGVDDVRRSLEVRLGVRVETVDARVPAVFADRIAASPTVLDLLAPLVGLLLRDHQVARA